MEKRIAQNLRNETNVSVVAARVIQHGASIVALRSPLMSSWKRLIGSGSVWSRSLTESTLSYDRRVRDDRTFNVSFRAHREKSFFNLLRHLLTEPLPITEAKRVSFCTIRPRVRKRGRLGRLVVPRTLPRQFAFLSAIRPSKTRSKR